MTNTRSAERRKERRFIVCGVDCWVDGRPGQIIDISCTGVRLLRPPAFAIDDGPSEIVFGLPENGSVHNYRVVGRHVRHTDIYVVFAYEPPCPQWETMLMALDTFEMTRLGAI